MLTIHGEKKRLCDGIARRDFLKIGALGVGGLSLANLFYDLLVNEHVGRTHAAQLAAVYRGFTSAPGAEAVSPLFGFYLAVYEALKLYAVTPAP